MRAQLTGPGRLLEGGDERARASLEDDLPLDQGHHLHAADGEWWASWRGAQERRKGASSPPQEWPAQRGCVRTVWAHR